MSKIEYKGFIKYKFLTPEEMAGFYENLQVNTLGLMTNEYALLYSPDDILVDKIKWNGEKNVTVAFKPITNEWFSKIKPQNIEQELAFDLLQDKNTTIKLITGKMGSGKTFLTTCHCLTQLKTNKADKIIYLRNNVGIKDVPDMGALPGEALDKLIGFAMPLADALGGKEGLLYLINSGKVEIVPLAHIRGRDFRNCCIMVSEAENLTKDHMQLLIGRVGEGSTLYLDGDVRQTDKAVFDKNNGIIKAINKLKGNKLFGYVELQQTERSETAALADLFDD